MANNDGPASAPGAAGIAPKGKPPVAPPLTAGGVNGVVVPLWVPAPKENPVDGGFEADEPKPPPKAGADEPLGWTAPKVKPGLAAGGGALPKPPKAGAGALAPKAGAGALAPKPPNDVEEAAAGNGFAAGVLDEVPVNAANGFAAGGCEPNAPDATCAGMDVAAPKGLLTGVAVGAKGLAVGVEELPKAGAGPLAVGGAELAKKLGV
jgi:hypothetical protein